MSELKRDQLISFLENIHIKEPGAHFSRKIQQGLQEAQGIAKLGTTLGTVLIYRNHSSDWAMAQPGDVLNMHDRLSTGEGGKTFIIYKDGTQLWLNENTEMVITHHTDIIQLMKGELLAFVRKHHLGENHFILQTPSGQIEVLGTEFDTTVQKDQSSLLTVLTGKVKFHNKYGSARLRKNDQSSIKLDTKPTTPVKVDVAPVIQWTGELVNQSLNRNIQLPNRLNPGITPVSDQPIHWKMVILIMGISIILGYLLGYFYGSF